jgi:hypothetical protein
MISSDSGILYSCYNKTHTSNVKTYQIKLAMILYWRGCRTTAAATINLTSSRVFLFFRFLQRWLLPPAASPPQSPPMAMGRS